MTRAEIINMLKAGIADITFVKVGGERRTIRGTLMDALLPAMPDTAEPIKKKAVNEAVVNVYEVDLKEWRSFRVDSVLSVVPTKILDKAEVKPETPKEAPRKGGYWGYHLMLDCSGCDIAAVSSREVIYDFVKELIKEIDMVAHGEPIIEHLLPGDPKQGFSLMQLITTSNICGHFMELDGTAYFDVFSCKVFDPNTVVKVVDKYFKPGRTRVNYITRHAD